jgi:hypothetical protein
VEFREIVVNHVDYHLLGDLEAQFCLTTNVVLKELLFLMGSLRLLLEGSDSLVPTDAFHRFVAHCLLFLLYSLDIARFPDECRKIIE